MRNRFAKMVCTICQKTHVPILGGLGSQNIHICVLFLGPRSENSRITSVVGGFWGFWGFVFFVFFSTCGYVDPVTTTLIIISSSPCGAARRINVSEIIYDFTFIFRRVLQIYYEGSENPRTLEWH